MEASNALKISSDDRDVVWPPMVVLLNTVYMKDHMDKVRDLKLLNVFKKFHPMRLYHAYGPYGDGGKSLLIFPETQSGYMDARILHHRFKDAFEQGFILPECRGGRQFHGHLAIKADIELFNKDARGITGRQEVEYKMLSFKDVMDLRPSKRSSIVTPIRSPFVPPQLKKCGPKIMQNNLEFNAKMVEWNEAVGKGSFDHHNADRETKAAVPILEGEVLEDLQPIETHKEPVIFKSSKMVFLEGDVARDLFNNAMPGFMTGLQTYSVKPANAHQVFATTYSECPNKLDFMDTCLLSAGIVLRPLHHFESDCGKEVVTYPPVHMTFRTYVQRYSSYLWHSRSEDGNESKEGVFKDLQIDILRTLIVGMGSLHKKDIFCEELTLDNLYVTLEDAGNCSSAKLQILPSTLRKCANKASVRKAYIISDCCRLKALVKSIVLIFDPNYFQGRALRFARNDIYCFVNDMGIESSVLSYLKKPALISIEEKWTLLWNFDQRLFREAAGETELCEDWTLFFKRAIGTLDEERNHYTSAARRESAPHRNFNSKKDLRHYARNMAFHYKDQRPLTQSLLGGSKEEFMRMLQYCCPEFGSEIVEFSER